MVTHPPLTALEKDHRRSLIQQFILSMHFVEENVENRRCMAKWRFFFVVHEVLLNHNDAIGVIS